MNKAGGGQVLIFELVGAGLRSPHIGKRLRVKNSSSSLKGEGRGVLDNSKNKLRLEKWTKMRSWRYFRIGIFGKRKWLLGNFAVAPRD